LVVAVKRKNDTFSFFRFFIRKRRLLLYRGLSFSPKVSESQDQRKVVINIVLPIEAYTFSAWGATVHSFSLINGN